MMLLFTHSTQMFYSHTNQFDTYNISLCVLLFRKESMLSCMQLLMEELS